ncbi:hypothetical protein EAF64_16595 [Halorientalis pallida]|uniref:Uncharacterized protein n=1 Tax=Halorientalis pallida TaxID=2479928 RepID=A0A498KYT2_9EURY|nr:hypothetical protein EAF64_16595 [Halorientalis pallida]
MSRPDLVLSAIPGPVALAAVLGVLLGVPLSVALAVGSLPSSAVVGYALFYRPPVESTATETPNATEGSQ